MAGSTLLLLLDGQAQGSTPGAGGALQYLGPFGCGLYAAPAGPADPGGGDGGGALQYLGPFGCGFYGGGGPASPGTPRALPGRVYAVVSRPAGRPDPALTTIKAV